MRRAALTLAACVLTSVSLAAPVSIIYVGTWQSTGSGNPVGGGGPGLSVGQKYVVRINYDTASAVTTGVDVLDGLFNPSGHTMSTVDLNAAGNSLDVWVPMEGLDTASPFVYQQNEGDHFPAFVPNPTLNFIDGSDISDIGNIIGLEFEGNFAPGAGDNVIELFNTSAGTGDPINMVSQILKCDATCVGIAATDVNGLTSAVGLDISAGAGVVFDAGNLTRTTSSSVLQSNDLGAFRSDGEDFVDAAWSVTGTEAGAGGNDLAVAIANSGLTNTTDSVTWDVTMTEGGTLLSDADSVTVTYDNAGPTAEAGADIVFSAAALDVSTSGATASDNDLAVNAAIAGFETVTYATAADGSPLTGGAISGSTVVNNIDQLIAIADSGLTTTTDTSSFDVSVTDFAGASDTDSALISYLNATPTASANAVATATGTDFTLNADDMDLIVNAIIAGFEMVTVDALVDGLIDATAFFNSLITTGSQSALSAALEAEFGLGGHTVQFTVTDRAGATALASADFEVLATAVPEPATLVLLLAGLFGLLCTRRGRSVMTARSC